MMGGISPLEAKLLGRNDKARTNTLGRNDRGKAKIKKQNAKI